MAQQKSGRKPLETPKSGKTITRDEIVDVLTDVGYSAGERKTWLKAVLTELFTAQTSDPDKRRERLISEVKEIIDKNQDGDPLSDDLL